MAESIADKYRTRFPPKEHEEAVRMLLEGAEKQHVEETINNNNRQTRRVLPAGKRKLAASYQSNMKPNKLTNSIEDRKSLNSSSTATVETNSSSGIVDYNDYQTTDSSGGAGVAGMQSKSTSTCESISTRSDVEPQVLPGGDTNDASCVHSRDLIPSRTIAVQCDLKWSSVKTRDAPFDTSMQASSISSTRYGFYNYNYETLAKRHRLQRSTSYRNLTERSSMYDDDFGHRTTDRHRLGATEALTSMSESEASNDENVIPPTPDRFATMDHKNHTHSSYIDVRKTHDDVRQESRKEPQQVSRLSARGRQMYGSVMDNSASTARARINSLPRRPMTALSYVSADKLRYEQQSHQQSDTDGLDGDSDDDTREQARRSLSKAKKYSSISHQNLVGRPKNPTPSGRLEHRLSSSNASSDSELSRSARSASRSRAENMGRNHSSGGTRAHNDTDVEDEENRRSEEVILKNTRESVVGQRPQLVEARHQEEVEDLNGVLEQFRRAESELRNNGPVYREPPRHSTLRATRYPEEGRSKFVGSTLSLPRKAANRRSQPPDAGERSEDDDEESTMRGRQRRHQSPDREDSLLYRSDRGQVSRRPQVSRSISMRQTGSRPIAQHYDGDEQEYDARRRGRRPTQLQTANTLTRYRSQTLKPTSGLSGAAAATMRASRQAVNADDSDAPESKTWSSPAGVSFRARSPKGVRPPDGAAQVQRAAIAESRKGASRSMSMRDVNHERVRQPGGPASGLYAPYRSNAGFTAKYNDECSSSDLSSDIAVAEENVVRNLAARLGPLDYDSQQRLNESGLPEVNERAGHQRAASYLGASRENYHRASSQECLEQTSRFASNTLSGGGQVKGRAMSQQSLSRTTMPAAVGPNGRRWQQAATTRTGRHSNGSASSDVGGSSMSLATRLNGRYESAHTRSPIVMYIPPAGSIGSRASSLKGDDAGSLLGRHRSAASAPKRGSRSPRTRSRQSSQDRAVMAGLARHRQRTGSSSRTNYGDSDSETSSILRTLSKARTFRAAADSAVYSSKRIARMQNIPVNNMIDTDDEHTDGVARLATELDSYKFSRRYSVPKDAKINWFARLRQRVAHTANR